MILRRPPARLFSSLALVWLLLCGMPAHSSAQACEPIALSANLPVGGDEGQGGTGTGGTGLGDSSDIDAESGDHYAQHGTGSGGTGYIETDGTGSGGTGWHPADGTGAGGTGWTPTGGTGTGGTGTYAQTGTGTGGTGLALPESEGGIGGTGVYGTITAFGSVCVNGLKVEYDERTPVAANGERTPVETLRVGQVVRLSTKPDDPNWARGIEIENPIAGPITRVDAPAERLYVMGAEVQLREGARFHDASGEPTSIDDLAPGTYVEVSGLRRSDGVVMASRLDARKQGGPGVVTGMAKKLGAGTILAGRVRARLADGVAVQDHTRIQVRGEWNPKTRTLDGARLRLAPAHDAGVRQVSVQGYVARARGDGDFRIAGTRVRVADATGAGERFELDSLVSIRGELDERGVLRARRIELQAPGREGVWVEGNPSPAAASDLPKPDALQSAVESLAEELSGPLDGLSPETREQIEQGAAAAAAAAGEQVERLEQVDHEKVEKQVERIERADRVQVEKGVERIERIERQVRERVERIERDERVERIEKNARDEIRNRVEKFR